MLLQLEKHISTLFYVGFVYVCSKAVPRDHVHPGDAMVLVVGFLVVNLFLDDLYMGIKYIQSWTPYPPPHTHPFPYPPVHSLFIRSSVTCL